MNRLSLFTAAAATLLAIGCVPNEIGNIESVRGGDLSNGPAPRAALAEAQLTECGPGTATELGVAEVLRSPYLQRVTHDGAWILWTGTGDVGSVVVTTPNGTAIDEVSAEVDTTAPLPEGKQFVAKLSSLEPDTLYCYEVHNGLGKIAERTGFHTAPLPGSDETVRFIDFGDMGKLTADQFAVLDQLAGFDYDFALLNGDIAYDSGTLSELENNFFAVYADIMRNVPFFPASGNHEYKTNGAEPFRQTFALFENGGPEGLERWYSFDWGSAHIVVLDTEKVNATQTAWLEADLAANQLPWTIVVGHKPPYSSGHHGSTGNVRDTFGPIFERYGVDVTFWGHDHNYERTVPIGGVSYIVAGAGGVGTRPVGTSSFTAYSEQVSHFVYGEFNAHELRLWAIDATGQEFDSLFLQK